MAEGTVKWFNPRKGYGFIAGDAGRDIFVHYASISGEGYRTLAEGDPVTFEVVEGEKGPRAEKVVRQSTSEKTEAAPKKQAPSEDETTSKDETTPEDEATSEDETAPEEEAAPESK